MVIDILDPESCLYGVYTVLGRSDDPLFLVEVVVDLALEASDYSGESGVELSGIRKATTDDQRRSGFIYED